MWIDRVLEFIPGDRAVAVKVVSFSEEHLHDHLPADAARGHANLPIMPASLIIEGMAQISGILVGKTLNFQDKVVLAKVSIAEINAEALPGDTIRHETAIERIDHTGASTRGVVTLTRPTSRGPETIDVGRIDLMFACVDRNRSGLRFPEHNFVLTDAFRTLLATSGFSVSEADLRDAVSDVVIPQRLPSHHVAP